MSGPYGMAGHDLESRVPCCDHLDISIVSASNRGNARLLFECHFLVDTTSTKQTTTEHIATLLLDETFAFTISDVQLSNRRFTARNRSSRTHTTIKTRETWHNELRQWLPLEEQSYRSKCVMKHPNGSLGVVTAACRMLSADVAVPASFSPSILFWPGPQGHPWIHARSG
jgi:hypothetical protein